MAGMIGFTEAEIREARGKLPDATEHAREFGLYSTYRIAVADPVPCEAYSHGQTVCEAVMRMITFEVVPTFGRRAMWRMMV